MADGKKKKGYLTENWTKTVSYKTLLLFRTYNEITEGSS